MAKLIPFLAAVLCFTAVSGIPVEVKSNLASDEFDIPNTVIFDLATLALQVGKFGTWAESQTDEGQPLQIFIPFVWNFNKTTCIQESCTVYNQQITIGGVSDFTVTTEISGSGNNKAAITFGSRNVSYSLMIPDLTLSSTDFQLIETNLNTTNQVVYSQLNMTIAKTLLGVNANFDFDQTLNAFQISDLDVTLELGELSLAIPSVLERVDGKWMEQPPIEKDAAPAFMRLWSVVEGRYEDQLEAKINAALSGKNN